MSFYPQMDIGRASLSTNVQLPCGGTEVAVSKLTIRCDISKVSNFFIILFFYFIYASSVLSFSVVTETASPPALKPLVSDSWIPIHWQRFVSSWRYLKRIIEIMEKIQIFNLNVMNLLWMIDCIDPRIEAWYDFSTHCWYHTGKRWY